MSYSQEIYDAARSRISPCDSGQVIQDAVRQAFSMVDHQLACVAHEFAATAFEQRRASAIYKPSLSVDGDQWCALYGDNLQDGVAGFGDSPEAAMSDFDAQWAKPLSKPQGKEGKALDALMGNLGFPEFKKGAA